MPSRSPGQRGCGCAAPAVPGMPVWVDAAEVGRALLNLVVNAIRHTPADGAVEVLRRARSAERGHSQRL